MPKFGGDGASFVSIRNIRRGLGSVTDDASKAAFSWEDERAVWGQRLDDLDDDALFDVKEARPKVGVG